MSTPSIFGNGCAEQSIALSPDGERVAFTASSDSDGNKLHVNDWFLDRSLFKIGGLTWSPNSKYLMFSCSSDQDQRNNRMYVLIGKEIYPGSIFGDSIAYYKDGKIYLRY